jgi:hypothetical protein
MVESFLHFLWQYKPFAFSGLRTSDNSQLEVLDPGTYNTDAGPDFFNAKVKLSGTTWVGNVEMHINSSEWFTHNHHTDSAYDNVVLHVVVNNDKPALNSKGLPIPTLSISYPYGLESEFSRLTSSMSYIPCGDELLNVDSLAKRALLDRMMVERLQAKTLEIDNLLANCNGSWEEVFYRAVTRAFGLKVNSVPAELLAQATPLKVLAKHKDNLFQLESLLFGQAGLLTWFDVEDEYLLSLRMEYSYLKKKFNLTPLDGGLWKFLRMRPASFPTIRLAQLSMLIHRSTALFSKSVEVGSLKQLQELYHVETSPYWLSHYVFGQPVKSRSKSLGISTINVIIVNAVIPFMFAYGSHRGSQQLKEKAISILEEIPSEENHIIKKFDSMGIKSCNSSDSQAVLQLKSAYCDTRKCIFCPVGIKLLLKAAYI